MTSGTIYLDNNATTQVAPEVLDVMLPYFRDGYGNPSSIHRFGGIIRRDIDRARARVAGFLGAEPGDICFTGCGSESDNMAIQGFRMLAGSGTRLITSAVEHPAVLNTCRAMKEQGTALVEAGVDEKGALDVEQLRQLPMDGRTLLSFMWANNETGVMFPIEQLTSIAHEKGARIHTDAVQAAGKIPIDVNAVPVDFLAISGHKLHAPKGIGALYIRKGMKMPPLIHGGHQESGMRAGTENVAFIVGLGKACELAQQHMQDETVRVRALRDRLERELLSRCTGAKLNGDPRERLPNTTNISFEFIEGEAILLLLDEKGIAASSGSACTTGSLEPSHVMRAMGVPYTFAHSSIRFSLSRYTTDEDIDTVIAELPPIIDKLRHLSPFVK